jgi:Tfp pilus assembly protein PilW
MKDSMMAMPRRQARLEGQRGLSLMEVVLGAGIGLLLMAAGGFLFLGQARGYKDIGSQAKLQVVTKNAVLNMNTELANTGACLANKRLNFIMNPNKVQFAYVDLKQRHCGSNDTVTVAYYVKNGTTGDTLFSKTTCNHRTPTYTALIKGMGAVRVDFSYYNITGAVTTNPSQVKSVEFSLDVKTKAGKSLFVRDRNPKVRVELLN